ncbi:chorismate mutase [Radiomyces spectabilis]|uniref:chorismate mutase n=1 Tax=Radiomyces spectabilis TaxID=64574 RepID=UPI00221E8E6E|nr:chorismate mutase [Radiomyces spectabilis]KAI8377925.1 chorismate mutase [Radiomyces spectabilis]
MSNFNIDNPFSLDTLRNTLIRLEDTIIFALIERAQFAMNRCIYIPGALEFQGATGDRSFLEFFLWETEKVHAKVRRYTSPDEYAFTSPLPEPILPPLQFKEFLFPNDINVNEEIMKIYTKSIVPEICQDTDDQNYGSSATKDIECLQALSRRIHYGKFIAESKFRSNPEDYTRLALANDRDGIYELLTNRAVEKKLLERLGRKALVYGQTLDQEQVGSNTHLRIPIKVVVELYERWVIPLTKQVEVDYLILRGTQAAAAK